jgi:hypothetical protein
VVVFPSTVLPRNPQTTGTLPSLRSGAMASCAFSLLRSIMGFASRCLESVTIGQYGLSGSTTTDLMPWPARTPAISRALVFSPDARSSSIKDASIFGSTFLASAMSWSVTPFIAETTTTTPKPFSAVSTTSCAACSIDLSFSSTDPPNFTTVTSFSFLFVIEHEPPMSRWSLGRD